MAEHAPSINARTELNDEFMCSNNDKMLDENAEETRVELLRTTNVNENSLELSDQNLSANTSLSNDNKPGREHWSNHVEYLLSMTGYCVGLGNLWRFPYLCMRNGGGAFLIPFLIVLVTAGLPLFFLEVSLGQFTGMGAMHVWAICPLLKGVGLSMIILSALVSFYYNMIIAWTMYYLGNSFFSPLPWTTCDNWWNTPGCVSDRGRSLTNATALAYDNFTAQHIVYNSTQAGITLVENATFNITNTTLAAVHTSEEDFWQHNVLEISDGLESIGDIPMHLALVFLAAWTLIFLCLIKGVRSIGKVVYVTAVLPYVLLFVLLIRGATLPGSYDGIIFYFKPDFNKLMHAQVWLEAALQVFYSLGAAWGPLITMASHNKFNNNCLRDAIMLTCIGEGTSIFGGFVVFTIIGFMAHEANVPIQDVVKSGPGLGFIAYPEALGRLPISQFWAVLFFIMLLTVGLDSQFSTMETFFCAITDTWPSLRKQNRRVFVVGIGCVIFYLIGLPVCTQGGMYIFQLIDWYVATLSIPMFGLIECLIIGWIYGAERYSQDVELMIGRPVPIYMRVCWCFVTPAIFLSTLIFALAKYKSPSYGSYVYPDYAVAIGWIFGTLPVLPIPVYMGIQLWKARGNTFVEKLRNSIRPSHDWGPVDQLNKTSYYEAESRSKFPMLNTVAVNILGHKRK